MIAEDCIKTTGTTIQTAAEHMGVDVDYLAAVTRGEASITADLAIRLAQAFGGSTRQRITKGPGSRKRGLMMVYKLLRMAEERWRRLNKYELLPLVRAGVPFVDGEPLPLEREEQESMERVAA